MSELTKAHIKFLQDIKTIEEKETNPFHKSKYASLQGALTAILPSLTKNGLAVSWTYSSLDGKTVLNTHLRHISGEELTSSAIYPETKGNNKLHDWGGNNTYMRRYTLFSILGICAGIEDLDGNHATHLDHTVTVTEDQEQAPCILDPKKPKDRRLDSENKKLVLGLLKEWCKNNPAKVEQLKNDFSKEFLGGVGLDSKRFWNTHLLFEKHAAFLNDYTKGDVRQKLA